MNHGSESGASAYLCDPETGAMVAVLDVDEVKAKAVPGAVPAGAAGGAGPAAAPVNGGRKGGGAGAANGAAEASRRGTVRAVAFSPDGRRVAVAEEFGAAKSFGHPQPRATDEARSAVHVWDVESAEELAIFVGHDGPVGAIAFSPDGTVLYTGSDDTTFLAWKVPAGAAAPPAPATDEALLGALAMTPPPPPPFSNDTTAGAQAVLRAGWPAVAALAARGDKAVAVVDGFYKLSAEDAELAALVKKLGDPSDAEADAAAKKLTEAKGPRGGEAGPGVGRALFRALLDPSVPAKVKEGARGLAGRVDAGVETRRAVWMILALERVQTPAAKERLKRMADDLPPEWGGNTARRALGLPPAGPEAPAAGKSGGAGGTKRGGR